MLRSVGMFAEDPSFQFGMFMENYQSFLDKLTEILKRATLSTELSTGLVEELLKSSTSEDPYHLCFHEDYFKKRYAPLERYSYREEVTLRAPKVGDKIGISIFVLCCFYFELNHTNLSHRLKNTNDALGEFLLFFLASSIAMTALFFSSGYVLAGSKAKDRQIEKDSYFNTDSAIKKLIETHQEKNKALSKFLQQYPNYQPEFEKRKNTNLNLLKASFSNSPSLQGIKAM